MGRLRGALGIRLIDVVATVVVAAAVELDVAVATGPGQEPLNATAYAFGAVVTLPILLRRRWPRGVLVACSLLMDLQMPEVDGLTGGAPAERRSAARRGPSRRADHLR